MLKDALKTADNAIAAKGIAEYKCPMGTTIALAIVSDYQMFYTWQETYASTLRIIMDFQY